MWHYLFLASLTAAFLPFAYAADSYDVYVTSSTGSSPGCQDDNACWSENPIAISQYDTVTWHNEKPYPVGIVSGTVLDAGAGDLFDSGGVILPEQSFSFTFKDHGTFEYFSPLQPWMTGTVIVSPGSSMPPGDDGSVADPEPPATGTPTCGPGTKLVNGFCKVMPAAGNDDDDGDATGTPTCGPGTKLVNGFCKVMSDMPACGPGTLLIDGKCVAESLKSGGEGTGGCLVATAAYGTELAPQVQLLREIRDSTVMSTASGTAFMAGFNQVYYSFSPAVADLQRENPVFQEAVRAFVAPMISTLSIMALADSGSEIGVLGLGVSVIALNLGMYVAAPALVGLAICRRLRAAA